MIIERTKNAKRNTLWGLFNIIVSLLLPFAVRTVLIKVMGVDYLGLNGLFTSILTVLSMAELGVGSAIVFSMYKSIAADDTETICALINLYKKIYRILGLIVLIIGCALIPFLKYIISGDIPSDVNLYWLYVIYLSNSVLSYWLFAYKNCLIHAHQRDDVTSKINLISNFFMYGLQIAILFLIKNYYVYIVILPTISAIRNITTAIIAKKMYPQYICKGNIESQLLHDIKRRISGLMVIKLSYVGRNAFDSIIISALFGLKLVAIYNNYFYIINSVSSIMIVFTSAISAGLGNSVAVESTEKNLRDMNNINYLYMQLTSICTFCLISMYQPFMYAWVGEDLLLTDYMMIIFVIYFFIVKMCDIPGNYIDATGLWQQTKLYCVFEAITNLVLNILLGYFWGILGILLATIITVFLINFFPTVSILFKHYFKRGIKLYILDQIWILVSCAAIGCVVYFLCNLIPYGNNIWMQILYLICRALISVIVGGGLLIVCNCWNKSFRNMLLWLKPRIFKQKKN